MTPQANATPPLGDLDQGRRERKKAATRASISAAALALFLERGFDAVSIRDIAADADVAVATIFKHFDGKEALVFDEDTDMAKALCLAVIERPGGMGVLEALERWFMSTRAVNVTESSDPTFVAFRQLVNETPALHAYWRARWQQHESALADAILDSSTANPIEAKLLAHLALEGYTYAASSGQPRETISALFNMLRKGTRLV